ncbi:MAG: hypothetical protein MUF81_16760 [Verrucomicrobia bacterium]|nr:hypothetical protein [Verrucomicrobiota bacterium]
MKAALAKRNSLEKEIAELNTLAADTATRRATLETSCKLDDDSALSEVSRCQVLAALLPTRIIARENAFTQAEADLLKAAHDFISQHLSPRIHTMIQRAKEKARAALQLHFTAETELVKAVDKSSLVVELEGSFYSATIRNPTGVEIVRYAEKLLSTWADCDEREAKLS